MKKEMCVTVVGLSLATMAADVVVPAGDSAAFRKAVYDNYNTGNTIVLPPGRYDASGATERTAGYHLDITGMRIKGDTTDPREVVVYGDGTKGVFFGSGGSNETIEYVTISNGCNATSSGGGGACNVYMLRHCVVTHCKATAGWGGGLSICNAEDTEICYCSGATFGGGASDGILTRCEFHHNDGPWAGGAGFRVYAYDCYVHENTSGNGGAFSTHMVDRDVAGCTIVSNRASDCGGAIRCWSNNITVRNCTFAYNTAQYVGGAVYGCTVTNCAFRENSTMLGGAIAEGTKAIDCRFFGNTASDKGGALYKASASTSLFAGNSAAYGGAAAGDGQTSTRAVLVDCVVSNNTSTTSGGGIYLCQVNDSKILLNKSVSYGGGASECTVSNCVVAGNALTGGDNSMGGGCYYGELVDCKIYNNYGGLGSGLANGSAVGCVISNNVSPHGVYAIRPASSLVNCYLDVQGVDSPGRMVNCVVTGAGRPVVWAEGDNAYTKGTFNGRTDRCVENSFAGSSIMAATNCLFTGNACLTLIHGPTSLQNGIAILSSCTIAGNRYDNLLNNAPGATGKNGGFMFENCVIGDNLSMDGTTPVAFNFGLTQSWNIGLESCLFDAMLSGWESAFGVNNVTVADVRFDKDDPEHPHSLKRSSPARKVGVVRDWMNGANDIRGEGFPRLDKDGKVDLGCYQCWLEPKGLSIFFR